MFSKITFRQKLYLIAGLVFIVIVFSLFIAISRVGKTKVTITAIPEDSQVTINKQSSQTGDVYLTPGKYVFSAKKDGFLADTQTIDINGGSSIVGLTPAPNSSQALKWLKDNPDIQRRREAIGGQNTDRVGQQATEITPIISLLPITNAQDQYSIDYGASKSRSGGSFILITSPFPDSRDKALQWIKDQGYDPTDLEIVYDNFSNPLKASVGGE